MDRLQRTPVTLEDRQLAWQWVVRDPGTEQLKLTLFALTRLISMFFVGLAAAGIVGQEIARHLADWGAWQYVFAILGALAAGLVGIVVGFLPFDLIDRIICKRRFRQIREASDEELWKMVDCSVWYFRSPIALIQLAARGRDVSRVLPRLIQMLDSSEYSDRRQASVAFFLVFFDEARVIPDYRPDASHADCRAKVAKLKEILGQTPPMPSNTASESPASADSKTVQG